MTIKHDLIMLKTITQMDIRLALRKLGSEQILSDEVSELARLAKLVLSKYDSDSIMEKRKEFLPEAEELQAQLEKLYATAVAWDFGAVITALRALNGDEVAAKFDVFKLAMIALLNKIDGATYDENGNLTARFFVTPLEDEKAKREIKSQPGCGSADGAGTIPISSFASINDMIDNLELDHAVKATKVLMSFNYSEEINQNLNELIGILESGEFEKADESIKNITVKAVMMNQNVSMAPVLPRVLAIDNDNNVLESYREMLKEKYTICAVTNHIAALRFLEINYADIIIIDIELSMINGFAVVKMIRGMDKYENANIILTGPANKEYITMAIEAGLTDYLRKPVYASELIFRIERKLGK